MAGAGSRFTNAGHQRPKYLIEVSGKSLLEHSLSGLPLDLADEIYFVALHDHAVQYDLSTVISKALGGRKFELLTVPAVTRGQAETVLVCRSYIDTSDDLVIFNIDTYYKSHRQRDLLSGKLPRYDGFLGSAYALGVKWSFAETNETGFVTRTTEKVRISDNALTGFYHFTKGSDFVTVASEAIDRGITTGSEFYIAPMYNALIQSGRKFVLDPVDEFIPLGTPEDIETAKGWLK